MKDFPKWKNENNRMKNRLKLVDYSFATFSKKENYESKFIKEENKSRNFNVYLTLKAFA